MQRLIQRIRERFAELRDTRLCVVLRNKYVLTSLIFFLWLLVFDQNNLSERRKINLEYRELIEEKEHYLDKIEEDSKRIEELKTDDENLEKFAREQYLMKKENEDIFIIVEE